MPRRQTTSILMVYIDGFMSLSTTHTRKGSSLQDISGQARLGETFKSTASFMAFN